MHKETKCILNNYDPKCVCAFVLQLRDFSDISSSSSASSDVEELEDAVDQEEDHQSLAENLAEPEFSGLWAQDCKVPKTSATANQKQIPASC